MAIVYSCILRKGERLVETFAPSENVANNPYIAIVNLLSERIDYQQPIQKSYMHGGYSFNYIVNQDELCFMAVANKDFQTRICFAFLARVVNEYNPGSRYKSTMAQHMDYFSNNAGADKIRNIQSEVDKVKTVMQKNIDDILARGEKLDKLVEDTDKLEANSKQFKEGATSLKHAMWCRNVKLTIAIIVVVLIVAFFVVVGVCGGFSFKKCGGSSGDSSSSTPTTTTAQGRENLWTQVPQLQLR